MGEIVQFVPKPNTQRQEPDFPTIRFRSVPRKDDLVMEQPDTAPAEYCAPDGDCA